MKATSECEKSYENELKKIKSALARIAEATDTRPRKIHWGHVGSAAHLREQLDYICEFLGI